MRYVFIVLFVLSLGAASVHDSRATAPAASDHQPPRFLPAVALYVNKRFMAIEVGKTFQFSCKAALDDTASAIAKAQMNGPPGTVAIGLCIPIPTYDPADLAEGAGQQDAPPAKDNTV